MMTMKEIYCLLRRLMNSSPSFVVFQSSPSGMHSPSSLFSRYESIKMILMSLFMTFNKAFDVPVFWPILVVYFLVFLLHFRLYLFQSLCFMTLKQRISHMIKYKYAFRSLSKPIDMFLGQRVKPLMLIKSNVSFSVSDPFCYFFSYFFSLLLLR